jgi:hypothetical protein
MNARYNPNPAPHIDTYANAFKLAIRNVAALLRPGEGWSAAGL